jgi:hypothetical protein
MADIAPNIDEVMEVDELLNLLDITIDDETSITDGEITYNFYTLSNLDDEKGNILSEIGFEKFKESIFFIETKGIRTQEILVQLLPIYQKQEIDYWDVIIEKLVSINERKIIFSPTSKQLRIISRWKRKLVQNEGEFRSLVSDLCLLFRDSCKNKRNQYKISENCLDHTFWKTIGDLRNYYYSHNPEQWSEKGVEKFSKKGKLAYEYLFSTPTVKKSSIHFTNAQFKLLTNCADFLDRVLEGFN